MDPNGRQRRKRGRAVHGWVVLDKPLGLGSTSAVAAVRRLIDARKAGHAGTLDPLATGILPIALGEATKTVPFLMDAAKSYAFDIAFGTSTETLDAEGEATGESEARPAREALEAVLLRFIGDVAQVPPKYSAIKIGGKRAYDLARAGEAVEIEVRTVRIDALRLDAYDGETASLSVDCGKGTYVRSLARDICQALSTDTVRIEGHVSKLRRTRVGPFGLERSLTLDGLEELCDGARADEGLLPLSTALDDIPVLAVTEDQQLSLKQGRAIAASPSLPLSEWILAEAEGSPVALCQPRDSQLWPKRVFNI
ncbi:MAG: tRNA pseudouridine(55) synthase TruB [Pseudomonadota bacterium]